MSIEDQLISEIKPYINNGNLDGLKEKWLEYRTEVEFDRVISWDYIFQKIYLHAALKKQKHICEYLDTLFTEFPPVQQIALRQMFAYGRYLLNK
jgi:hypothetical protein